MFRNKKQSGSVLIIAVFVIVVMGMLGLTLTRLEWSTQDTLTREVLGTQAWLLANSGNEWGLTHLYPLDGSSGVSSINSACSTLNTAASAAASTLVAATDNRCSKLTISCTALGQDDLVYFKVTSGAVCGTGQNIVQREQEVWARGLEE